MKKLLLGVLCVCLPLASYAQTAAEKALEALLKPAVKEISVTVPVTGKGAAFDLAQATSAIKNVISRQYGSRVTTTNLIRKAKAENRATIPAALLANEILNKEAVMLYNFAQMDSLWWAYKRDLQKGISSGLDQRYFRIRPTVEAIVEQMKAELRAQTTSPIVLFNGEQLLKDRLFKIEYLSEQLESFHPYLEKEASFIVDGQDALAWLKYYYLAVSGTLSDVPVSVGEKWRTK